MSFEPLARDGQYSVEFEYEQAVLRWPGGILMIGDHYGEPACGLINVERGWCVTGGEGLMIALFEHDPAFGQRTLDTTSVRLVELWRRNSPPVVGTYWWVPAMWKGSGDVSDTIRVAFEGGGAVGIFDVDVRTGEQQRLCPPGRRA